MCGANPVYDENVRRLDGSSPRVRGKHDFKHILQEQKRIIPACAGQTITLAGDMNRASDHPRVCGANSPTAPATPFHTGSSPRVRGKLLIIGLLTVSHRIIPACAGQT